MLLEEAKRAHEEAQAASRRPKHPKHVARQTSQEYIRKQLQRVTSQNFDPQSVPNGRFLCVVAVGFALLLLVALLVAFPQFDRANERDRDKDTVITPSPTVTLAPTVAPTPPPSGPPSFAPRLPVERYGQLAVEDGKLVSTNTGDVVQLSGMSLFWSNTDFGGEIFYSAETIQELARHWNCSVVRAAMGIEDSGGYIDRATENEERVRTVVEAAIDEGIYVIVDWHSHEAENFTSEASRFFQEMATDYGEYENVIFEIYNEPIYSSWTDDVKPYAEEVIRFVRTIEGGEDVVILVGSPEWSQDVDVASEDPITFFENIAYVLHFYAGSHGEELREKAQVALDNGVALFVSEFGTVEADGDGAVDAVSTFEWIEWLDERNISYVNWAINDKDEGASALDPGTPASGWTTQDLTTSGTLIKGILAETAARNAETSNVVSDVTNTSVSS
ncbi:hypothetical protein CTAYLR_007374 [Chrysophaeum taylorii]|uniref:Glycoside hydrolase family 5 domain-containing protein n=1 Tax=Chrysophaeum taylorii TaxID=2483200 RepID=A0AAD7U6J5_9STRA|nr:hypothetical protein CTAYLR_007374 [Chrysophaeum taylorii]